MKAAQALWIHPLTGHVGKHVYKSALRLRQCHTCKKALCAGQACKRCVQKQQPDPSPLRLSHTTLGTPGNTGASPCQQVAGRRHR